MAKISAFNIAVLRIALINSINMLTNRKNMILNRRNVLALADIYHIIGMHDVVNVKMLTVEGRAGEWVRLGNTHLVDSGATRSQGV